MFEFLRSVFGTNGKDKKSSQRRVNGTNSNRKFKKTFLRSLLLENLETRQLFAANPVAQDDTSYYTSMATDLVVTTSSSPAHLRANDLDIDSTTMNTILVAAPSNGTIVAFGTNGTFTYRPNSGFSGIDTFWYKLSDGVNESVPVRATVAVGTRWLGRQTLDSNVLQSSIADPWLATSVLEPIDASQGLGMGAINIPSGSSQDTDGALAASGGLQLMEDVAPGFSLAYRSSSITKPIIAINTQLAPGINVPTSLSARITLNGVAGTWYSYNTSGLQTGQAMRFALQADGSALTTGIYDYTVEVTSTVNGVASTQSFTGKQPIVNRASSEFGAGWGLNGLDRLFDSTAGALAVRGNGDWYWFSKSGSTYQHALGDTSYSNLVKNGDNTFTLTSKTGIVSNFSTLGLLTTRKDPNNNTITFAYADRNADSIAAELISITDPFGRVTNFNYTSGKATSISHFSGRTTTLTYTGSNLTGYTVTDPDGAGALAAPAVGFAYASGNVSSRTNPLLQTTSFAFGAGDGRLRTVTYPDSRTWQLVPSETIGLPTGVSGNTVKKPVDTQATVTDQRNNAWKFRTDRFGGITESITAMGFIRTASRDADGNPYVINEPDPDGTGPLSSSGIFLGYNANADLTHMIAPDNGVTTMTYSATLHRLLSATDPVGRTTSNTYNAAGNQLTSVDGAGFTTTYVVNSRGLPTSITPPDPDGAGPLTSPVTNLAYDSYSRLITLTNPDSSTQTFTYNAADQILTTVDELVKTTTIGYDSLGRMTSVTDRVSALTQWTYDAMSRMTQQMDPLGNLTNVAYNNRGWASQITYPDPDGVGPLTRPQDNRIYDGVGNLLSQGDAGGNFQGTIPYTFDPDNRLLTVGSSVDLSASEKRIYDNAARLISVERVPPPQGGGGDPDGGVSITPTDRIEYVYDAVGRVVQQRIVRQNVPGYFYSILMGYNLAGEKTNQTDGRANGSTYSYDARGLLVGETSPDPDGSGSQFPMFVTYAYDNMSRPLRVDRGAGRVTTYEFNARSWLTKVTEPDPDGTGSLTSPVTLIGYNLRGDQTSITDPLARITSFAFDNEQRLISRTDPDPDGAGSLLSPVTNWTYNVNSWLTSVTNPAGALTTLTYDGLGRLLTQTSPDPDGAGPLVSPVTVFGYNMRGLATVTDPMTRVTSYVLDNRGRTQSVTDTAGAVTDVTYDFYNNVLTRTEPDPDGAGPLSRPVYGFSYDAADRKVSQTDPINGVTNFAYDGASNLVSITDPVGNVTQFGYDSWNRQTLQTNSLSLSQSFVYDTAGNLTRTVDRNGKVIQYLYDALDRQIEEKWQQTGIQTPSLTVSTTRDGSVVNEQQRIGWNTLSGSVTNMSGTFTLTQGGQTTAPIAWNANAATIQAALESLSTIGAGNVLVDVVASTSPSVFGRTITLSFRNGKSGQNLPQTTISISSLVQTPTNPTPSAFVSTVVDGASYSEQQVLALTGASGGTWRVAYNGEVSAPLSPTITPQALQTVLNNFASIDSVAVSGIAGQQYNVTFGGTQSTTNMQQIFGDAANISNTSIRSITTSYNAASEVLSVNDPTSNISFVRDNLGRATTVASTVSGSSFSMGQSFDVVGNRTELRATGSGTLDFRNIYSYDKLNRLTEVIQTNQIGGNSVLPKRVTMAYNALGQRTQLARFQSTGTTNPVATTDTTYDTANRLSGIAHKQGSTNLNTYAYTYDPLSRLTSVTSTLDGLTSYTHSQNDQLLGAVNTGVPNESFGYDANGNRNTTGFTTSSDNRMTASPGFTYLYDNEGNLTRKTNTATGNYTTYNWDHRNRLTQVTERTNLNSLVSEINYEYDAFNRLSRRYPTGGWSTYWVYDEGINPVLEYDSSASPSMTHRYLWSDNVDELLADEQNPGLSSKNTLWALSDHLGSIRDIADTNETTGITSIANHRRYDSTGKRISETNASVDLVFGYTGKLSDETTGLQNNLNRWLDPATGRWISQDPIGFGGGDANLYRYVGNGPTNATDPSGLWQDGLGGKVADKGVVEGIRQYGNQMAQGAADYFGNSYVSGGMAFVISISNNVPNPLATMDPTAAMPRARAMAQGIAQKYEDTARVYREHGAANVPAEVLGTNKLVEAIYNVDLSTGEEVGETFDRLVHGGDGLKNNLETFVAIGSLGTGLVRQAPKGVLDDVVRSADRDFAPGSLNAAKSWTQSSRLRAYQTDYNLPIRRGYARYIPPESWSPNQALPRGTRGGFIDKFGNEWVQGPSRTPGQAWEWDVQLGRNANAYFREKARGGTHVNVSWDGEITH